MTQYRRHFLPGGSYFFTVNLANRRLRLLTDPIEALRAAFRYTLDRPPFTLDAIVVLPEHLHAIWTLPHGDAREQQNNRGPRFLLNGSIDRKSEV